MPGLAALMIVVPWIGCLPAGRGAGACACAVFTSVTCAWVSATALCVCCCCATSCCTICSSCATRASSSFSLAVSASAAPGASNATTTEIASKRRCVLAAGLRPAILWVAVMKSPPEGCAVRWLGQAGVGRVRVHGGRVDSPLVVARAALDEGLTQALRRCGTLAAIAEIPGGNHVRDPRAVSRSRRFRRRRGDQARRLRASLCRVRAGSGRLLGEGRRTPRLGPQAHADPRRQLRPQGFPHPLVRRRRTQCQRQLPRSPPRHARRQDRADLGIRRSGCAGAARELSRTAPARLQARQCAAQPRGRRRATASPSTCR